MDTLAQTVRQPVVVICGATQNDSLACPTRSGIHLLKTLAGHRSISTTAAYLYSSPSQLKAAVELI